MKKKIVEQIVIPQVVIDAPPAASAPRVAAAGLCLPLLAAAGGVLFGRAAPRAHAVRKRTILVRHLFSELEKRP